MILSLWAFVFSSAEEASNLCLVGSKQHRASESLWAIRGASRGLQFAPPLKEDSVGKEQMSGPFQGVRYPGSFPVELHGSKEKGKERYMGRFLRFWAWEQAELGGDELDLGVMVSLESSQPLAWPGWGCGTEQTNQLQAVVWLLQYWGKW